MPTKLILLAQNRPKPMSTIHKSNPLHKLFILLGFAQLIKNRKPRALCRFLEVQLECGTRTNSEAPRTHGMHIHESHEHSWKKQYLHVLAIKLQMIDLELGPDIPGIPGV